MSLAGGILSLAVLLYRGTLLTHLRQGWVWLLNLILSKEKILDLSGEEKKAPIASGIPYGVAIALGMVGLFLFGSFL
jgi:Flp pilus assembly protein protease CpaA